MKQWSVIETKKDYEAVLGRIDTLMDKNPVKRTSEGRELSLLLVLVELYEDQYYSIDSPDPIEAIKVRMEDLGLTPKDLIQAVGDKGTVSKVLNHKLPLSLRMIRNLSAQLSLPAEVLIKESVLEVA